MSTWRRKYAASAAAPAASSTSTNAANSGSSNPSLKMRSVSSPESVRNTSPPSCGSALRYMSPRLGPSAVRWRSRGVMPVAADRLEVQRIIPASPAAIFRVLCDPQGHVAIDSSGMLMDAEGEPVSAPGDSFVVHMDREALNDYPLGR